MTSLDSLKSLQPPPPLLAHYYTTAVWAALLLTQFGMKILRPDLLRRFEKDGVTTSWLSSKRFIIMGGVFRMGLLFMLKSVLWMMALERYAVSWRTIFAFLTVEIILGFLWSPMKSNSANAEEKFEHDDSVEVYSGMNEDSGEGDDVAEENDHDSAAVQRRAVATTNVHAKEASPMPLPPGASVFGPTRAQLEALARDSNQTPGRSHARPILPALTPQQRFTQGVKSKARPTAQSHEQPSSQGHAPSPAVQSYATSPAVASYAPSPAIESYAPSPAIESYAPSPVIESYAPPPAIQSYAPPVVQSYLTPILTQVQPAPSPRQFITPKEIAKRAEVAALTTKEVSPVSPYLRATGKGALGERIIAERIIPGRSIGVTSPKERNQERYVCERDGCTKTYATRNNLRRHQREKHESGTRHQCTFTFEDGARCTSSFGEAGKLRDHVSRVHNDVRDYECIYPVNGRPCGKAFKQKCDWKRHVDAVHQGKKFACTACGKKNSRKQPVTSHRCPQGKDWKIVIIDKDGNLCV